MNYVLKTERLTLREFTLEDTEFIIRLLNTPGWLEFIGDRNVRTIEQAANYLQNGPIKSYELNGYGLWLVEYNSTPIGMCGLIKREDLDNPDIGFAYLPEYGNRGYAIEMANAVMKFGTEKMNLSEILAITIPGNTRSINVLEKIGMLFVKKFSFPGKTEELLLYSISNASAN